MKEEFVKYQDALQTGEVRYDYNTGVLKWESWLGEIERSVLHGHPERISGMVRALDLALAYYLGTERGGLQVDRQAILETLRDTLVEDD